MSGIYIPGAKIPDGDYVRVLMLHKDGTCVDGIGNVFKVIPVPPHGDLIERDKIVFEDDYYGWRDKQIVKDVPTVILADPAEEGET